MRVLCLDVGNSQITGGAYIAEELQFRFNYPSYAGMSADSFGIFLTQVLMLNHWEPKSIEAISIGSVVPNLDAVLEEACKRYCFLEPFFVKAGVKTGLQVLYDNPQEVGVDRIANAVAAVEHFPGRNLIIGDLGTASVICAVSANKEYLGGAIWPGFRLCMESLNTKTAKLFPVRLEIPKRTVGKTTTESIQSGLYHAQLGTVKLLVEKVSQEHFTGAPPIVIGTGGFAKLLEGENIWDIYLENLNLEGLRLILAKNRTAYAKR